LANLNVTERGPVRWTLRCAGRIGPHQATLETRLYRSEKRIEFRAEIDWTGMDGFVASHVPYPGKGLLAGDMPFCVEEKHLADEPYVGIERQRPGMFIAQSFVDWSDDQRSIAYISHDGDRYYVFDEQAQTLAHILVNSIRRPEDTWEQHVNTQMQGVSRHAFTYSLVPHAGSWRNTQLWRVASQLRNIPLRAWPGTRGSLPAMHSLMEVSPPNVSLSACYLENGKTMIRAFENAGTATTATIALPAKPSSARVVDLLGKPVDGPKVSRRGNTLSLLLEPWQIATIAIGFPGKAGQI